jgi:hypothetical protein
MGLTRLRASQISDIDYKQAVRAVTTSNVTLSGGAPATVDGVSLSLNNRILVTAQSIGSQNGIYTVTTVGSGSDGTWVRSADSNATGELPSGTIVMVTEGIIHADTQWKLITNDPIVIDTTPLIFTQNYSANSISGGSSNVNVYSNASVTISSAGTANVLTVSNTGIVTSGQVSATGNITGNYFIGNGSQLTGISGGGGGSTAASALTGNTLSSNVINSSLTSVGTLGSLSVTGNILGGVNVNATTYTGTTASLTGNVTGGNIITGGLISATGAVTGASITGTSLTVSTGNITAGNLLLSGAIIDSAQLDIQTSAANANIVLTPNGTGNVNVGRVSASGNITAAAFYGPLVGAATSATTAATVTTNAQPNITSVGTLSSLTVTANTTVGNLLTGGLVSATGNITGGNLLINGSAQISGNLTVSGTETIFNVANLTVNDKDIIVANNVTGGANINGAGLQAGNPATATWFFNNATTSWQSNIGITPIANGTLSLGGASNYWGSAFLTTATVTGNVTSGNINTAGTISSTNNGNGTNFRVGDDVWIGDINLADTMSVRGVSNAANGYIVFGNADSTALGRAGSGPLTYGGAFSATGNITGGNILGGANVNATTHTGTTASLSGNVTGGNILTGGLISATGNITGGNILGGANVNATTHTGTTVSVTGNVNGGNLIAAALVQGVTVSASGNVIGGNVTTAGLISATGNITGGNILGGANVNATTHTGTTASLSGNVTGGNILTGGLISATGNVNGGNLISAALVQGVTVSASGNVIGGNVTTAGLISATGNVTGGNVITAGLISATGAVTGAAITGTSLTVSTGNITAGNLLLSGAIVDSAQLDIQTSAANANIVLTPNGTGNVNTGANVSVTGAITGGGISTAGNIVGNNISTSTAFVTKTILETVTVNGSAFANPSNYDILTQSVWYSTAAATTNFTLNIRGNSSVTANTLLAVGQSMTFSLLVTNTGTAYYPSAFQVDGSAITPIYQGGTAFTAGNTNATDVYLFTLIKTAATPTYKLLASQTKFA